MEALTETRESPTPAEAESDSLAVEMAAAYAHQIGLYREHLNLTTKEAAEKADAPPADEWQDRVLKMSSGSTLVDGFCPID